MADFGVDIFQNEAEDGPLPIPSGDRFVYFVPSERNPKIKYRVDIVANNGAGHCVCPDFGTRRQVALNAGACTHTDETLCKHLKRCIRYFNRRLFSGLAKQEDREC